MHAQGSTHHAVLLLVLRTHSLPRELAFLADRHERGAESHRDDGPQEESSRVQADDDIDLLRGGLADGVRGQSVHEVRNEGLESNRISKEGEDVQEDNALFVKQSAFVGSPGSNVYTVLGQSGNGLRRLLKYSTSAMVAETNRGTHVP